MDLPEPRRHKFRAILASLFFLLAFRVDCLRDSCLRALPFACRRHGSILPRLRVRDSLPAPSDFSSCQLILMLQLRVSLRSGARCLSRYGGYRSGKSRPVLARGLQPCLGLLVRWVDG